MKRTLLISFILFLAAASMTAMPIDTIRISEVSVTAKRNIEERGISISSIDSSIIRSHYGSSLSDLLASNTTVFMKTYGQGALSTISFRGTSASHTRVTWNGIPLNNPMLGQVDFSLVPVNFTDKITLLHGGSSLQDGSGALGGSINLESSASWNDDHLLKLSQGFGSFGTYRSNACLQFGRKHIRWRLKFFHERSENDFLYLNTKNGEWNYEKQKNADYQKSGLLGEVFIKPGNNNIISLHAWMQSTDRNFPTIMSYAGMGRNESQADDKLRLSGIWKHYGHHYRSELTLGYSFSGINYLLANVTESDIDSIWSNSKAQNAITSYKITADIGAKMILKSQLDYKLSTASILAEDNQGSYEADRQELGLRLSLHRQLGKHITTFGLLRTELVDQKIIPLKPSLGMEAIIPMLDLKLLSNITRNYSLPTLNDLYWVPGGNPDLQPEEGYTGDISFTHSINKYEQVGGSITLTGFASSINNWILWSPGENIYWTAENIARVFTRGLEYSMSGLYRTAALDISLYGSYSFTRTSNQSPVSFGDLSVGKQLIYIPIHKANASLNTAYKGNYLMINISYIGERFTTSSNEDDPLDAFTLFDLRIGKDLKFKKFNTSLQLKINNLFNRDYEAILSRPMPGRSWEVVLRFEI